MTNITLKCLTPIQDAASLFTDALMCLLKKVLKEYDMTHGCKVIIRLNLIPYVVRLHAQCVASKAYLNHGGCN